MTTPEWQNPVPMEEGPRRMMRADAERNRRRLLDAATEMFCERGLDVGVGEIAQHAGVGRGTLFRNFPSKEHLIAAILVERITESIRRGRDALAGAATPGRRCSISSTSRSAAPRPTARCSTPSPTPGWPTRRSAPPTPS